MTEELTKLSAARLAELIRRRAVSPVEVMAAHLARIERVNPSLNAIVTLAPDALEQAREAERVLIRHGAETGALHGVPLTFKDTIAVRGMRATSGSRVRADFVPTDDAGVVARVRAAGAIILGKTNTPELALDYTTDNLVFGRTLNPHDAARTPGGSSGGCAAAVSACLVPASLGSDLAASVRLPAHFCGIVSFKPEARSVSGMGHYPPMTGSHALGAVTGPLARRVEDLALIYQTMSEDDAVRGRSSNWSTTVDEARASLRGARGAWYTDDGNAPVTDETRSAVEDAARALDDAGVSMVEMRPPGVEHAPQLWPRLFSPQTLDMLRRTFAGCESEAGETALFLLERGAVAVAAVTDAQTDFQDALDERERLRAGLIEWMRSTPLIIAPVGAVPAFAHDARRIRVGATSLNTFRAFGYAQTFNVFDLPVACVPAGRSREGLPIGVQIIGRPSAERAVFDAARIIEAALGGWQPPPETISTREHNPL